VVQPLREYARATMIGDAFSMMVLACALAGILPGAGRLRYRGSHRELLVRGSRRARAIGRDRF
jgi:hypothetical protein